MEKNDNDKKNKMYELIRTTLYVGMGLGIGFSIGQMISETSARHIPDKTNVKQGYVIPSKLEVSLKDIDGDGQKEFRMIYDGKPYLFKLDANKKPVTREYSLTEIEIKE
jgi:hypothetical protein